VITNFDENRQRHLEAAQGCVDAHIDKFEALKHDVYKCQGLILNLVGVGDAWREAEKVVVEIKRLIESLVEVYEIAVIEPRQVLKIHAQGRYTYQRS
jgi:acyl-CoA hydrolase